MMVRLGSRQGRSDKETRLDNEREEENNGRNIPDFLK
jgi:hypothetical protein